MTGLFETEFHHVSASESVVISALEFDVLWEKLQLTEMPLVLKVPSPGKTYTERARIVNEVWQSLQARHLVDKNELDQRLEQLIRSLDHPTIEVDGRLWLGHETKRLLVAATGNVATLAELADQKLTLRPVAASGPAREALSTLPELGPGAGHSVTLPSDALEAAAQHAKTPLEFANELRQQGVRGQDAAMLSSMIVQVHNHGQFGAAARDRLGQRYRAPWVVGFFDTSAGRYLQMRRESADGQPWSTISPADNRLLLTQIEDMLTAAQQQ